MLKVFNTFYVDMLLNFCPRRKNILKTYGRVDIVLIFQVFQMGTKGPENSSISSTGKPRKTVVTNSIFLNFLNKLLTYKFETT